jgi:hypothetical protein
MNIKDLKWPPCMTCARKSEGDFCEAFPEGIPVAILEGVHKHRTEYIGDRGLRYLGISKTVQKDYF